MNREEQIKHLSKVWTGNCPTYSGEDWAEEILSEVEEIVTKEKTDVSIYKDGYGIWYSYKEHNPSSALQGVLVMIVKYD